MGAGGSATKRTPHVSREAEIAKLERRQRCQEKNEQRQRAEPNLNTAAPDAALRASAARGDAVLFPAALQLVSTRVFGGTRAESAERRAAVELPLPVSVLLCKIRRMEYCIDSQWHSAVKRISIKPNRTDKLIYLKVGRGRQAPIAKLSISDEKQTETLALLFRLAVLCDTGRVRHNLWRHLADFDTTRGPTFTDDLQKGVEKKARSCEDCSEAYSSAPIFCASTGLMHPPQFWGGEDEPAAPSSAAASPHSQQASPTSLPPVFSPASRLLAQAVQAPPRALPHWKDATPLPAGLERRNTLARSCLGRKKLVKRFSTASLLEGKVPTPGYGSASVPTTPTGNAAPGSGVPSTPLKDMVVDLHQEGTIALLTPLRLEWYDAANQWKSGILGVTLLAPFTERKVRLATCEGAHHTVTFETEEDFREMLPALGRLADAGCVQHDIWTGHHHTGWLCPACLFRNPAIDKPVKEGSERVQTPLASGQAPSLQSECVSPTHSGASSPRSSTGSYNERHSSGSCQMCGTNRPSLPQGVAAGNFRMQRSNSARPAKGASFSQRSCLSPMSYGSAGVRRVQSSCQNRGLFIDTASCGSSMLESVGDEEHYDGVPRHSCSHEDLSEMEGTEDDEGDWNGDTFFTETDTDDMGETDYSFTSESDSESQLLAVKPKKQASRPSRSLTTMCAACEKQPRTTVLVPCRHLCLCASCATDASKCPICNELVTHSLQVWI